MTLNDIMHIVDNSFGDNDHLLEGYWDFENETPYFDPDGRVVRDSVDGRTDGLVRFLVIEVLETYDILASDEDQLEEATRVVSRAREECDQVVTALQQKLMGVELVGNSVIDSSAYIG